MSPSTIQHNDKVALVTGAASGIGRATALAFAQSGVKVVLADISVEPGEGAAAEIEKQTGIPTSFVRCDVSKSADVERMVHHAVERFGRIDYAFNNAGTEGMQAATAECSEENFDRTVAIDLKGTWLCMKYEIPQMLKQGGGAIVNCSSIAGLVAFRASPPTSPASTASSAHQDRGSRICQNEHPRQRRLPWCHSYADGRPFCRWAHGSDASAHRRRADRPHRRACRDRRCGAVLVLGARVVRDRSRAAGRRRVGRPVSTQRAPDSLP